MGTKEKFNPEEWIFERSSGYAGERNTRTDEWINSEEFSWRKRKMEEDILWEETVFRIIKLHTFSDSTSEKIVEELRKKIGIYEK